MTGNIKRLHIIRGIAALIVVVYHSKFILWCGGTEYARVHPTSTLASHFLFAMDMLSSCGRQCVIVFFVLSAVVISYTYQQSHYSIFFFYLIRIIRIYIPFIASLLLSVLILFLSVKYLVPNVCDVSLREFDRKLCYSYKFLSSVKVIRTAVFIRDDAYYIYDFVYWSLSHELIYYLLAPFYLWLSARNLAILLVTVFLLWLWLQYGVLYYQLYFIAGTIFYQLITRVKPFEIKKVFHWFIIISILILYVAMNLLVKTSHFIAADFTAFIISILSFSWLLLTRNNIRIPSFLYRLADISYTLYLNHLAILVLMYSVIANLTGSFMFYNRLIYYCGVGACILLSVPLYFLFEKNSLKYISYLKRTKKY